MSELTLPRDPSGPELEPTDVQAPAAEPSPPVLRRLAADTHDFEARYLDGLVGPLPSAEELYIARSPLSHLDRLTTPMLLEQGLEDLVVPPSQSEAVRDALAANGVPHAYLTFEGEGHGFRRADTVTRQLDAEVAFLGAVLGFEPDGIQALDLE